ncbi:MAG: glycine--tRNA ligase subunit beta [Anaerolineae bacterium]|nr:glycine--tRNA ligase subunit beta [Anaerolineae bacterium]
MTEAPPRLFQDVIMALHNFWAAQGCVLWQPYNIQVGAGTANPATTLRVLGPEPWRVAYVEPSVRPDDGRYGENPNRMQYFYQYQVILKPDPGNPQELYLASLEALGLDLRAHDVRFVEDNWESPALGAWGLGWEVWLDGQEITQYTYFQQAGGLNLDPVSVEITYGIERIVLALQAKNTVWEIDWLDDITYGDIYHRSEWEHSKYYFEVADVTQLSRTFDFYEAESRRALTEGLILPAYDYSLKLSHLFNILDTRGAVGVTERAAFFRRMAALTNAIATAYVEQRQRLEFPLIDKAPAGWTARASSHPLPAMPAPPTSPADVLIEIGVEELPPGDLDDALLQLEERAPALFEALRLDVEAVAVMGTPRRLVVYAKGVAPRQRDTEELVKGPPVNRAYDADGNPTQAALGFARGKGVDVGALEQREMDGGHYVVAVVREQGRPATEVLAERLPDLTASLRFGKPMRWNASGVAFSRPIRWILALFGGKVIPFAYAGVASGKTTRGLRAFDRGALDPRTLTVRNPAAYFKALAGEGIVLDPAERAALIAREVARLAAEVGGRAPEDPALLREVTNMVERPTLLRGHFDEKYLNLPDAVLVAVMKKHQRYFPVVDAEGRLMPYFIAARNGDDAHLDIVTAGNEHVILARFADADFFCREDCKRSLEDFLPRLATKTFQEKLGSYLDKSARVTRLIPLIGPMLGLSKEELEVARRAAHLSKADQATQMVTEMTSLEGVMGREYARIAGEPEAVAQAIYEGYLPRSAGDALPQTPAGAALAIVDRLDSLAGLFAVGLAPTASADPFGLRRAALGLVQILLDHALDLDLRAALKEAATVQLVEVSDAVRAQIVEFVAGRLFVLLRERGEPHDVVEAVLAAQGHNPHRASVGVSELAAWTGRDDWPALLDAYARCVRITRGHARYEFSRKLLVAPVEDDLYTAYQEAAGKLDAGSNVGAFLEAFAPLAPAIARFFASADEGGVLVMDPDMNLRQNRLALLQRIGALAEGRADLSKLEGF